MMRRIFSKQATRRKCSINECSVQYSKQLISLAVRITRKASRAREVKTRRCKKQDVWALHAIGDMDTVWTQEMGVAVVAADEADDWQDRAVVTEWEFDGEKRDEDGR